MSEITIEREVLAALQRQMTLAAARQAISASNLANLNTPGYRAREADFGSTPEDKLAADGLQRTAPRHLAGSEPAGPATKETEGLAARRDGR